MNLPRKVSHYLRGSIDFDSFFILDIVIQDSDNAVLLLAPRDMSTDKYFCMQYRENVYYYGSVENMMRICVESKYISRSAADKLIKKYYKYSK